MTWSPLEAIPRQWIDAAGNPLSGYWLIAFRAGTTTRTNLAIDVAGTGSAAKFETNSLGYLVSSGDAYIRPHADRPVKLVLVPTEAEADASDVSNAVWSVDNVVGFGFGQTTTVDTLAALKALDTTVYTYATTKGYSTKGIGNGEYDYDSGSSATADDFLVIQPNTGGGRWKLRPYNGIPNILQAGAIGDGATDDTTAKNRAVNSGVNFFIPDGIYLCDGIKITTDKQSISFGANVILKANANNVVLFWQAASSSKHSGRFQTNSNSKTGVWATLCGPSNLTQTTTLTQNNFNEMPGVLGDNGLDELHVLQCGPDVSGADSGCFYNEYPYSQANGSKREFWLRNPPNAGGASPNRNKFFNCRAGTSGGIGCNTGVQIDAGDTNTFFGCDFEGVETGTSPNAIPTGVKIAASSSVSGAANNSNRFYGSTFEACTRDIENANAYTEFYGCGYADSKCLFTEEPLISIGGNDSSQVDQRVLGLKQIDGASLELSGITDLSDTGKKWQSYPLTTSNMIHSGGAAVTSVAESQSKYWQFSGMVFWSFRVQFRAANTNAVRITLPVPEEINQYSLNSATVPMRFFCVVNDGVTEIQTIGNFVTGADAIEINHSGLWDTTAANNAIHVQCLMYHKA